MKPGILCEGGLSLSLILILIKKSLSQRKRVARKIKKEKVPSHSLK